MKENLHRRRAVRLPPARVGSDDASITIVVPGIVAKNASHVGGRGGARFTSAETKRYRASVAEGIAAWTASGAALGVLAHGGEWHLDVLGVWPRRRDPKRWSSLGGPALALPMGDVDAAVPQALDALVRANVIKDDCLVTSLRAWTIHRKIPTTGATAMRLSHAAGGANPWKALGAFLDARADLERALDLYLAESGGEP